MFMLAFNSDGFILILSNILVILLESSTLNSANCPVSLLFSNLIYGIFYFTTNFKLLIALLVT